MQRPKRNPVPASNQLCDHLTAADLCFLGYKIRATDRMSDLTQASCNHKIPLCLLSTQLIHKTLIRQEGNQFKWICKLWGEICDS